ncbi:unnamed protein product (macronuclear) [Paramecium tetraurelia]|uniref:Uncharacterized protein n=1 Tax=Paramecium tetraurelia TaxID=5888 RepID=A0E1W3_PARTE|nr:uncharacterized protein GSPATT00022451001 [Paramecium tetraurelia]CAK89280.1 unnamed protein product [Paramecium tetraurelia]|eukprot:XP_001456677.1 hypothetical protein (macronuclear) [Paramecium tetraurelia strain d4-2]
MGCCQDRPNTTLRANELRPLTKAPSLILTHKAQVMEPMKISIIGDIDQMDFMDEFPQPMPSITQIDSKFAAKQMSSREFKETRDLVMEQFLSFQKLTQISETIIIDMRSGTFLQSPLKPMSERHSSKNLNSKFIGML